MDATIVGLLITQAISVILAMLKAWFALGKLIQKVENIDNRLIRLEQVQNHQGA